MSLHTSSAYHDTEIEKSQGKVTAFDDYYTKCSLSCINWSIEYLIVYLIRHIYQRNWHNLIYFHRKCITSAIHK